MSRKIAAILLIIALAMVLFFTFQQPEQSRELSETVRIWLENIGISVEYKELRSKVHILEYFIVGLAVCGFCRSRGWKAWIDLVAGCVIGVLDESIKVWLPGREFSFRDLIMDFAGIGVAICFYVIVQGLRRLRQA